MSLFTRATAMIVVCLCASATALALPSITAAASGNKVRFTAPGAVCQIRVQVFSIGGAPLFDSSWKDGNVFDWKPEEPAGGSYRCVVSVKDLDGQTTQRETTLVSRDGQLSIEPRGDDDGPPKVTLLAHDGANGAVVSTSGDLSFRFGNFLAGKEVEKMRLTSEGKLGIGTDKPQATLDVNGTIRALDGIVFADGTTLRSEGGQLVATAPSTRSTPPSPAVPRLPAASKPKQSTFTPAYQFVVGDSGVSVGTTNPAYNLTVTGEISTGSRYDISGGPILSAPCDRCLAVGWGTGHNSTGSLNTFVGVFSAEFAPSGTSNVTLGTFAGQDLSSGSNNTLIGQYAGNSITTENNNTVIGSGSGIVTGVTDATVIGVNTFAGQSNTIVLGHYPQYVGASTSSPNQALGVGGGITVDENNMNNGTLLGNSVIAFGTATSNAVSGEAIASQRTGAGNLYGLDFYTQYAKRMTIFNDGHVQIYGNLTKGGGSFKIDHPLDPRDKYLSHSFVESPDMKNIYDGVVTLDEEGEAVVQLPDWFEALNQDFRYQLTCLHGWAPVYVDEEIANNQFKIAGGKPGMKVSWQVTGIRHDPYANAHRIVVEEEKPPAERGTYMHPDVYAGGRD